MLPNDVSYLIFGKKHGFQCFNCSGFLSQKENSKVRLELEAFLQLNLSTTGIPEHTGLWASYRFSQKQNHYICFVLFFPARDAVNRPGFYGSAVALRNKWLLSNVQNMIIFLNNLANVAAAFVKDEPIPNVQIPEMELLGYPEKLLKKWMPRPDLLPVLVDVRPSIFKFIEATYFNFFGIQSDKAFFVQKAEDLEAFDETYFSLISYEELLKNQEKNLVQKIDEQFRIIQEKQEEKILLDERIIENEYQLLQFQEMVEKLGIEENQIAASIHKNEQLISNQDAQKLKNKKAIEDGLELEKQLTSTINDLQVSQTNWNKKLQSAKKELREISQQRQRQEAEIKKLKKENALLNNALLETSQRLKSTKQNTDQAKEQLQKLQEEINHFMPLKTDLLREIDQLRDTQTKEKLKLDKITGKVKLLKLEVQEHQKELNALKKALNTTESSTKTPANIGTAEERKKQAPPRTVLSNPDSI